MKRPPHPWRMQRLHTGAALEHYRPFPNDQPLAGYVRQVNTDWTGGTRDLARSLHSSIVRGVKEGRCLDSLEDAEAALRYLAHLANAPSAIAVMARDACLGLLLEALEEAIHGCALNESDLAALDALLLRMDVEGSWARAVYLNEKIVHESLTEAALFARWSVIQAQYQVKVELFRTAIAVQRFYLRERRWPEALEELAPDFLEEAPRDPFGDAPIRLTRVGNAVYLHSVGYDGVPATKFHSQDYDEPFEFYCEVRRPPAAPEQALNSAF